jgi:hypothetical protein
MSAESGREQSSISMAEVDFTPAPIVRAAPKPKMTIYYALLIIALLAMLVACLFMYLEIRRFGGFGAVKGKVSSAETRQSTLLAQSLVASGFRENSASPAIAGSMPTSATRL